MSDLYTFSDPKQVLKLAKKYIGKDVVLKPSTRKDKKYMVINPETNKWVHFGQMGYEDFTKHKDQARRHRFQLRNKAWADAPKYTPAWLSYYLLW